MATSEKFINPFTDFGFKKIFGTEENKELLIHFLNTLLPVHHQITTLEYKRTDRYGNTPLDRKAVYDLYCQGADGSRFTVEMQKAKQTYFKDRALFYTTFPIQEQAIQKDNWNFKLAAVYTIAVLDFTFDRKGSKVVRTIQLKDEDNEVFYKKLLFVYLVMPNFNKPLSDLKTFQDKWLFVLKNLQNLDEIPSVLQDGIFKKLFKVADLAGMNRKERQDYEESLKYYRDLKNVTDTAKTEGKMEGKIEGKMEGKIEGKIEGKMQSQVEIVMRNHKKGRTNDFIEDITGLTAAEVHQIIQDYQNGLYPNL
jgi:predicted transposase/invertase (TIGR01784 family)